MTQADLAKACGVHVQTIGNLERALHETSPELLTKVGNVLGVGLTPAALAAQEAVDNVRELLMLRLRELDSDAERLVLVSDTLHFVAAWQTRNGVSHEATNGNGGDD